MTGQYVAAMATRWAGYLNDLAIAPLMPASLAAELSAGASALTSLAANPAECDMIAAGAQTATELFQALWNWMSSRGHTTAAKAISAT